MVVEYSVYNIVIEGLHLGIGVWSGYKLYKLGLKEHRLTKEDKIEQSLHLFLGGNALIHILH